MAPGHHNLDCVSISLSYRLNCAKMHIISKWKERESKRVCVRKRERVCVRVGEKERVCVCAYVCERERGREEQ